MTDNLDTSPFSALAVPSDGEAVFLVDYNGIVRFAVPQVLHEYGYTHQDVIGRSVLRFCAPEDSDVLTQRWLTFRDDSTRLSAEMPLTLLSANERRRPGRVSIWRLPDRDEFMVAFHTIDQTRDRLETLYSVLMTASSTLELDEVLTIILKEAYRLIPCQIITIFMLEHDGSVRVQRIHQGECEEYRSNIKEHWPELETNRIIRETGKSLIINDCDNDPRWVMLPDHQSTKSWLGVPLIHCAEFLGELNLDSPEPNSFTQEDAELAQALATQVAAALYNARLYETATRRAEWFQALGDIGLAISHLSLRDVADVVYRKISGLMDASTFFIGLYDSEADSVHIIGAYEHGRPVPDETMSANTGLVRLVLRTGESVIIRDSNVEPFPPETIIDGDRPRSLLMMPLFAQDTIVGVITVQSYQPNAYSPGNIAMLESIAGSVAAAIQNARLYDQTADRLAALEALHQMGLPLTSAQDLDTVAKLVIQAVLELFSPAEVWLFLSNEPPEKSCVWVGRAIHLHGPLHISFKVCSVPDPIINQVWQTGQPVIIHKLDKGQSIQIRTNMPRAVQAAAVYPIRRGQDQLGALAMLHWEPYFFRSDMLRALELLCMQAAIAFQNARHCTSLHRSLNEVQALQDLARRVSASRSLDDILNTVVQAIQDIYGCKSASIWLLDEQEEIVALRASVGIEPQYLENARLKLGDFVAGQVVATGAVVHVPDTQTEKGFHPIDPTIRSMLSVPLTVQDRAIGTLNIDSVSPNTFSPDHERILTIAGGQIAAAIETVRLLQETHKRAAELEQLNSLRNELILDLSHELRSPLALIRGYVGLMRDEQLGSIEDEQAAALDIIQDKSDSIARLIDDILSLELISPKTLDVMPCDITDLCCRAVDEARIVFADKKLTFRTELLDGKCLIGGDCVRLSEVLDNLLGNAAKFTLDGGTITLRMRLDDTAGRVEISVIDTGIGIPADKLPHIFERFYQVNHPIKYRFGGAGLGLSIAQRIIEAHSGTIWVESDEGKGSTFTFVLPLHSD
ncbi:MAG: GAF domain-containing protein [Anaerolineae bacterium]|nr:GAF domain-containing protein [Anaerolineae bacterium]